MDGGGGEGERYDPPIHMWLTIVNEQTNNVCNIGIRSRVKHCIPIMFLLLDVQGHPYIESLPTL